jgi:hypothetical protein
MRTAITATMLMVATTDAAMAVPLDVSSLARRGRALGATWFNSETELAPLSKFTFTSRYDKEGEQRGWANWLIEHRLMVGQYPHCQPAVPGPDQADAEAHLELVISAGVDCFVCLQAELPPQQDASAWPEGGVPLANEQDRARWPAPFVRYAPTSDAIALAKGRARGNAYLHCPIVDLSTPRMPELLTVLDGLLAHYEGGGQAAYVHCWGGRGRAGLVSACLLALVRPDLDAPAILEAVQAAYDTRTGAEAMPAALKRSPQTEPQRKFVRSFVSAVRASRRFDNDLDMQAGGMPKGYL